MANDGKHWAKEYILDPLNEPEPSAQDGPGTSFKPAPAKVTGTPIGHGPAVEVNRTSIGSSSTNPFRRSSGQPKSAASAHSTPVRAEFPGQHSSRNSPKVGADPFPALERGSLGAGLETSRQRAASDNVKPRRSSSLSQRYPGDKSIHPLETITRENKMANRSPHLRKKHLPQPDMIDRLDPSMYYHHESPYDPALMVRNTASKSSPIAALENTNQEALKATPYEKVQDSLRGHNPLDGTAIVPPGQRDQFGNVYEYEEGTDMMRDLGGNYKRWEDVDYHPDDLKGKGEPSYSIEQALKGREKAGRYHGANGSSIELTQRPKSAHNVEYGERYTDWEPTLRHRGTSGGEVRRRMGSLRRKERAAA